VTLHALFLTWQLDQKFALINKLHCSFKNGCLIEIQRRNFQLLYTKQVSSGLFSIQIDLLFSASHDKAEAKIWRPKKDSGYSCLSTLKAHVGPIVGLTLHATNDYVVTASTDGSWAFHDIHTTSCLAHVQLPDSTPFTCTSFHPDGLILGTGTANTVVRIWDIKNQQNVVSFEGHEGAITDLAFSENGFYLATASEDGTMKLWDLRKLKNIHTHSFDKGTVDCIDFDFSGTYLATGGTEINIFVAKTFELVKTISDLKASTTDVKFGPDELRGFSHLASVSHDRNLRIFGRSSTS